MYKPEDLIRIRKDHNLTQQELGDKLQLSREMIIKMEKGGRKISKATAILLDKFTSEQKSEQSTTPTPKNKSMNQDRTEELIQSLNERITDLKASIRRIEAHNDTLQNLVQVNLMNVLKNQVVHEAAMEARQDKVLELLAKDEADFDRIFDSVYKTEAQIVKEYDGTDNRLKTGIVYKK